MGEVRSLSRAHDMIARLQNSTKRAREKAGELVETVITTAEVGGTAFAFGVLEGRIDNPEQFELFGVPVPLVVGVGGHIAAMLGVGRGMDSHLRNIANGALATHLNGVGRQLGREWKSKTPTKGELPGASANRGSGITEADLRAYAS